MQAALKSLAASIFRRSFSSNWQRILLRKRFQCLFSAARHPRYYSQHAQDLFLDSFVFHGERGGTFLDIGAYDGVTLSNTYFFEKALGWSGVCVEPNPSVYAILKEQRTSLCLNCGISAEPGELDFMQLPGDLALGSGFVKFYGSDSEFARRRPIGSLMLTIPTKRIMDVIAQAGLSAIDYLSIDTEGADFDILKSIDFDRYRIRALSVENSGWEERISVYMKRRDYRLAIVLGNDEIYIRQ